MELTTSLSKSGLFTSREDKKDQVETYFKEEIKAGSSIYTKSMFKSKKFTNNQNLVSNVSCLKYYSKSNCKSRIFRNFRTIHQRVKLKEYLIMIGLNSTI